MTALVSRTGRHQQRYEHGYRLVAGYVNVFVTVYPSRCSSFFQRVSEPKYPRLLSELFSYLFSPY